MSDLLTIGQVAEQANVATSTIRYYERRGLLSADARVSGQRRYRMDTLRRLVFIGMMRDAGLALDDIDGILNAATVTEWKAIARRRLEVLDEQITKLRHAREFLALALNCRFDHPATDCTAMGAEIDRRLNRHSECGHNSSVWQGEGLAGSFGELVGEVGVQAADCVE